MDVKISGIAHVGLYIKDLERSKSYYTEILGFKKICEFISLEGNKMAFVQSGNLVIELIQHKNWMNRKDGLYDHIAMQVEDIEEAFEILQKKGILFEGDIYYDSLVFDKGVKYVAFRGPDGEHLELYQIM